MRFKSIIDKMDAAKHLCISAHTNPDGDAIGAMVAIGCFCKQKGINYTLLLEKPTPLMTPFLESVNVTYLSDVSTTYDCFVALDCGNAERLVGYVPYFKNAQTTLCIDHHITNAFYGDENEVDPKASSTSELVYELIEESGQPLDTIMAQAIYMGIVTDTGGFMHDCTTPRTHEITAKLIACGFDFTNLYYKVMREVSYETIQLQGIVSTRLEAIADTPVYMAYLTQEDLEKTHATKEDLSGIVSFLKNIKGVACVALLYPINEQTYKLSMRANPPYDVAAFCEQFGGGGHRLASGASINGDLDSVRERLKQALIHWDK